MRRLFLQMYAGVALAVIIGIVAAELLTLRFYDIALHEDNERYINRIREEIIGDFSDRPIAEWPRLIERWESVTEYQVEVIEADDPFWSTQPGLLPDGDQLALQVQGGFKTDYIWAALRLRGRDQILLMRYTDSDTATYMAALFGGYLLVIALVAAAIYLLVKPTFKITQELSVASQHYAAGDLDARVPITGTGPLSELADQFNHMAADIQQRIREQRVMNDAVSHELKTPITRLRLALDMALASEDPERRRQLLAEMDHDLDDLDGLTGQLLTLAKLTYTGEDLPKKDLAVKQIIQNEYEKMRHLRPGLKMALNGGSDVEFYGNEEYFELAIHNLLVNAQRYADAEIAIEVGCDNEYMRVSVDDDGPGIPAEQREHVFLPFARLDPSRTRKTGGYGLGLAIARQSVEKHRGNLSVDEGPLGGARFVASFPRG